jgi:hypothetical protein
VKCLTLDPSAYLIPLMWIPWWLRSVFLQKPLGSMFSSTFNFFPSLYSLRWCGVLGALCPYAITIMCRPPPQPTVTANCPSMAAEVFRPWCIYQLTWGNAWEMFVNLLVACTLLPVVALHLTSSHAQSLGLGLLQNGSIMRYPALNSFQRFFCLHLLSFHTAGSCL